MHLSLLLRNMFIDFDMRSKNDSCFYIVTLPGTSYCQLKYLNIVSNNR